MRLIECLTVDLRAKTSQGHSLAGLLKRLVFDPGYRVVVYYRVATMLKKARFARRIMSICGSLILVRLCRVPGVEIRTEFEIGEGVSVYHPHDIVIGYGSRIGRNVTIYNGVTLGARTLKALDDNTDCDDRYPVIEDGVIVFAAAKIIGRITIGRDSIVGANSVVNTSFEENGIIAGVPARLTGKVDERVVS